MDFAIIDEANGFPSSERRGGCAEGADGVVILDDLPRLTTPALRATPPFLRRGINAYVLSGSGTPPVAITPSHRVEVSM